jgi:predicted amidohydrolase YtcJ
LSPEVGCTSVESILNAMRVFCATKAKGSWCIGVGYDDTLLKQCRHPTRMELDSVSVDHPIVLQHISGHVGVASTRAFRERNGVENDPLAKYESGLLIEGALFAMLSGLGSATNETTTTGALEYIRYKNQFNGFVLVSFAQSRHGITTACECWFTPGDYEALRSCQRANITLPIDLVVWPIYSSPQCFEIVESLQNKPIDRVRVGGVKLILDGSIQGKQMCDFSQINVSIYSLHFPGWTAHLSQPYHCQRGDGSNSSEYCGHASMTQTRAIEVVKDCLDRGLDVQIHCNGDGYASSKNTFLNNLLLFVNY